MVMPISLQIVGKTIVNGQTIYDLLPVPPSVVGRPLWIVCTMCVQPHNKGDHKIHGIHWLEPPALQVAIEHRYRLVPLI